MVLGIFIGMAIYGLIDMLFGLGDHLAQDAVSRRAYIEYEEWLPNQVISRTYYKDEESFTVYEN